MLSIYSVKKSAGPWKASHRSTDATRHSFILAFHAGAAGGSTYVHLRIKVGDDTAALLGHTPRGHGSESRDRGGKAGGGNEEFHGGVLDCFSILGR